MTPIFVENVCLRPIPTMSRSIAAGQDSRDLADVASQPTRASFDDRYDGPFSRPSLAAGRRHSPPLAGHDAQTTWEEPTCAEALEEEVSQSDAEDLPPPGTAHLAQAGSLPALGDASAAGRAAGSWRRPALEPVPPPLNYTLRGRRTGIALFVLYTFLDSLALPVGLYFLLWYGFGPGNPRYHPLDAGTVLTVVTTAIGGTSIYELLQRGWRLGRRKSDCRVSSVTRNGVYC